jgi:hypothetical protein
MARFVWTLASLLVILSAPGSADAGRRSTAHAISGLGRDGQYNLRFASAELAQEALRDAALHTFFQQLDKRMPAAKRPGRGPLARVVSAIDSHALFDHVLRLATFSGSSSSSGKENLSVAIDEYGYPTIVQQSEATSFEKDWPATQFDFRGTTLTVKAVRSAIRKAPRAIAAAREAGTLHELLLKDEAEDED